MALPDAWPPKRAFFIRVVGPSAPVVRHIVGNALYFQLVLRRGTLHLEGLRSIQYVFMVPLRCARAMGLRVSTPLYIGSVPNESR